MVILSPSLVSSRLHVHIQWHGTLGQECASHPGGSAGSPLVEAEKDDCKDEGL